MSRRRRVAVLDTTFLLRLRELELLDRLPLIFDQLRIPTAVRVEIGAKGGKLKRWLRNVITAQADFVTICKEEDVMVRQFLAAELGTGEAAAIAQASEVHAALIIDEKKGREIARRMGVTVIPTGRVLVQLKEAGAIQGVAPYLDRLGKLSFHISEATRREILAAAGEV